MAANSEPVDSSNDKPAPRAARPARPLWQAPFVLGVAALVSVAVARPFAPPSPSQRVDRELEKARQILARPDGDVDHALRLARLALEEADQFPEFMGTASFLLGTAHMRLAEKADPAAAREAWQRAGQYLEQAEKAGVADEDQPVLMYRQGKVGVYNGDDLARVITRLEEATPRIDTRAEGYGLLTQAYLRLNPPDLNKALECNTKLRDVADATEDELSAAKLLGGELQLRLGKPVEARKTLEKIPDKAPPAVLVRARLLRVRSYQDEKQWANATRLYGIALANQQDSPIPEPARLYYNLGLCYRELDQPQEAAKAWQKCVALAKGEEGAAAAVVLANLKLLDADPTPALAALTRAVAKVGSPADWSNKLIDLGKVVGAFEKAAQVFREKGKHKLAMDLLESYRKVVPPFKVVVLRGDIASEWAAARVEERRIRGTLSLEEERAIQELYVKAGEAYNEAAATPGLPPVEQGQYLWQSAVAYQAAQDPVKAADRWEKFVKLDVDANKLGEAYYHLGEVYRIGKDAVAAKTAYEKCIEYETRFAYLARYQLAMAALQMGRVDDAEALLVGNLKQLRFESNLEALGQTLFALGSLLYNRKDYRGVKGYLETALGKFKDSPHFKDNAEVTQARYQLADSYRQLASQENQNFLLSESMSNDARKMHVVEHRRLLLLAAEEFASLDVFLDSPAGKGHLTPDQRIQVPLITAKCWFNLGDYEKALKVYERAIERYPDQVEGLDALGGAVSCHAALGQIDKVRARLLQIKLTLPKMPSDIRVPWENWLREAIKPLKDLEREGEKTTAAGYPTPVVQH